MADDEQLVSIEVLLAGRYRLNRELGEGVVARAFEAVDELTGEHVVCKVSRSADTPAASDIQLFRTEYEKLRRVYSPDFVRVLHYGEHAHPDGRIPFLVLERVDGPTLRDWADSQTPLQRLKALRRVAEALATAHAADVTHDDLHVGNVLVAGVRVVLIDPRGPQLGTSRPDPFASSRPKSYGAYSLTDDKAALGQLIQDVVQSEHSLVRPLIDSLQGISDRPSAAEVAEHLRLIIERSPITIGSELDRLADWSGQDTDLRHDLYGVLRKSRHEAWATLAQDVMTRAGKIPGVKVSGATGQDLSAEIASDDQQRGRFLDRGISCTTRDADVWSLNLAAVDSFRKPWPRPDRRDILSNAVSLVNYDGLASKEQLLMLWDGQRAALHLYYDDLPGGYVPIDENWILRCLAITTGSRVAGIAEPINLPSAHSPAAQVVINSEQRLTGIEAVRLLTGSYFGPMPGPTLSQMSTTRWALRDLWTIREHEQRAFLRTCGQSMQSAFGQAGWMWQIFRVDFFNIDWKSKRISVEVCARPYRSDLVNWRFDFDFDKPLTV